MNIKLLKYSFMVAVPLGSTLTILYLLINGALTDWTVIIDFNKYGEGFIELSIVLLWLFLFIDEEVRGLIKNGKARTNTRNTEISDVTKNARKQHYNL